MSKTYSIACKDCRKHLWIGQGSYNADQRRIYRTDRHLKALLAFLFDHQKHNLLFDENCESEIGGYEEIEVEP